MVPPDLLLAAVSATVAVLATKAGDLVVWMLHRAGVRDRQVRESQDSLDDLREEVHQATEALQDYGPFVRRNRRAIVEARRELDDADTEADLADIDLDRVGPDAPLSGRPPSDHLPDGGVPGSDDD